MKRELTNLFRAPTVVKLTAEAMRPTKGSMRRLRAAQDFADVFPNFDSSSNVPRVQGIESAQV